LQRRVPSRVLSSAHTVAPDRAGHPIVWERFSSPLSACGTPSARRLLFAGIDEWNRNTPAIHPQPSGKEAEETTYGVGRIRRGWVNYFAVGHSSECFSFIKDWVEKKVRRHMGRARNRKGFGWKRWSRQWLYDTLRLFNLPGSPTAVESCSGRIGPISLEAKQTGERSARKSARCVRRGGGWKRGRVEMV
jgi:hypothetical protein